MLSGLTHWQLSPAGILARIALVATSIAVMTWMPLLPGFASSTCPTTYATVDVVATGVNEKLMPRVVLGALTAIDVPVVTTHVGEHAMLFHSLFWYAEAAFVRAKYAAVTR